MAEEYRRYASNGAAAYQVYTLPVGGNTAQRPQHQGLPQDQPLPQRQQRVRAKTAVAPFTMLGLLAASCMLILVIFGYVQLYEATSRVSSLENRMSKLRTEQIQLQGKYDSKLDLKLLEEQAAALGLHAPKEEQIVYVTLTGIDRAEIFEEQRTSLVGELVSALEESVSSLIAYLRPAAA